MLVFVIINVNLLIETVTSKKFFVDFFVLTKVVLFNNIIIHKLKIINSFVKIVKKFLTL